MPLPLPMWPFCVEGHCNKTTNKKPLLCYYMLYIEGQLPEVIFASASTIPCFEENPFPKDFDQWKPERWNPSIPPWPEDDPFDDPRKVPVHLQEKDDEIEDDNNSFFDAFYPKLPDHSGDDLWLDLISTHPNNRHSCLGGAMLGCGTDDPDEAPSDSHRGKALPPDIGGPSQIPSTTVQRWVHRFLAMEDGKKDSRILPSGGPAPIDPAAPERPRRRKTLPPPPPYPTDPRRIRPADPDEFSSGVAGQTIVTLAKKTFPDIFAGDQVMPSSAGPRPFDPISLEKRRGTMVPPQDWDPYGPRVRTDSMRLPDD